MQVAVAGVEHVAHRELICRRDACDGLEHIGEGRAGDDCILHDEVARETAHRAERLLAALPQALALARVSGGAGRAGAVLLQHALDGFGVGRHGGLGAAVQLDEQHRRGVARIPGRVHGVLDRADARLVHHLERSGNDAAGDDG